MSGIGLGRTLEVTCCHVSRAPRLWADLDRPRTVVWGADNAVALEQPVDEGSLVPLQQAGARGDDSESDSDDSLEAQEFADMERLMEALDDAAVTGATSTST